MSVYLHCTNCHTRCKRTGNKRIEAYAYNGKKAPIYTYEYQCPNCLRYYTWDMFHNRVWECSLEDMNVESGTLP